MNLNQVTVNSRDVAKSVAFYRQLGLVLIVDSIPRYARLECPEGGSTFSIHHDEHASPGNVTLYFECADLDEKFSVLKSQGIDFDNEPVDQPWLWREVRLKDPDGHQLILFYAGENRKNPPWKIK